MKRRQNQGRPESSGAGVRGRGVRAPFVAAALSALLGVMVPATGEAIDLALPVSAYLTDGDGNGIDGVVSMTIRLYDSAIGGTMVHEEALPARSEEHR